MLAGSLAEEIIYKLIASCYEKQSYETFVL